MLLKGAFAQSVLLSEICARLGYLNTQNFSAK